MSEFLMCRMCLSQDVSLYDIFNKSYHEIYETLTNLSFHTDDGKPTKACYICLSQLKNCYRLKETALKADHILSEVLAKKLQLSPEWFKQTDKKTHDMCFSSLTHIDICPDMYYPVDEMTVLVETGKKNEVCVKSEQVSEQDNDGVKEETAPECDGIHHSTISSSDSEDNLPLKSIVKQKSQEARAVNGKVRKKEKKDSIPEECAKEIVLTKQQQLDVLRERAKSSNYINSPYKCEYCYKGFMSATTYDKHREKHDERAGAHECDVCHMRYASARQLRSHAQSAHARRYACARCGLRVHTANQAREHLKWHTGFTYECQLCGKKFSKSTSYLTHTRTRHPAPHACAACGLGFVGPRGLLVHRRKAHAADIEASSEPAALRYCRDCDVQFLSVEAWKRHVLTAVRHRPENDDWASCRICSCPLAAGEAQLHYKVHWREFRAGAAPAGRRPPALTLHCDQCTLTFGNKYKLQSHVKRVHLGLKYNKNVVCEVCGKKCTSNASLRYHQRTHTGERPYPCGACGKRFADSHHLRVHARTHSGERPYACGACDKRFSQKPALNRHLRVHTGAKPYVCTYCTKSFSQTNSLKLHIRSVHLKVPPNNKRNKAHNAMNDNIASVKNE